MTYKAKPNKFGCIEIDYHHSKTDNSGKNCDIFYENGVKLGEIICDIDGYYKYFPELHGGYFESYVLQDICFILDLFNQEFQEELNKYFEELDKSRNGEK